MLCSRLFHTFIVRFMQQPELDTATRAVTVSLGPTPSRRTRRQRNSARAVDSASPRDGTGRGRDGPSLAHWLTDGVTASGSSVVTGIL